MSFDLSVARKYISKQANAEARGVEFTLTLQSMANLMKAKKCFYTGITLTEPRPNAQLRGTDRTIDRIDGSKGYVKGNVVACCYAANNLKAMCENGGVEGYRVGAKIFNKTLSHIAKSKVKK